MRCANSELLGRYLDEIDKEAEVQEEIEAEFYVAVSDLRLHAIRLGYLELLREVVAEEFDLVFNRDKMKVIQKF